MGKTEGKRAAIYIRVSSELQAEKVSPGEQESDCKTYARENRHKVVAVYRDINRYRVGNRLVEPSGTRRDRPGYKQMLADAAAGKFELLIAWREDRLYRGLRPMLDTLDMVKQGVLDVELVKETFDTKLVPIKASIAEWEIDSFRQRSHMGAKARLRQKKAWGGYLMFGYMRDGDFVLEDPEEAKWVRTIFQWYTTGIGVREISRKLIAEGAPPKRGRQQTIRWPMSSIYRVLNRDCYATGIHKVRRDGELFELPIPKLIDLEIFNIAQQKLQSNRTDRGRNVKYPYLLRGLLTSPCNSSRNAYTRKYKREWTKKSTGERLSYPAKQSYYRCALTTSSVENLHHPECPKTKGVVRLDAWVWGKVADVLRSPDLLTQAAEARFQELKSHYGEVSAELSTLEVQLQEIESQRGLYIEKFGRDNTSGGPFTESDLDIALERLANEEMETRHKVVELQIIEQTPIADLDDSVSEYLNDIGKGLNWLDRDPEDDDEAHTQFTERRQVVTTLVDRVTIRRNTDPELLFAVQISKIPQFQSLSS